MEDPPVGRAAWAVLLGLSCFFLIERLALWRHCHDRKCEIHSSAAPLVLLADALHDFVDDVAIAVAFLVSVSFGVATTVAVAAHEIPQEIGDFFILLENGFTRRKAFLWNGLSGLSAVAEGLIACAWMSAVQALGPYVMALSSASFVYIPLADLIPGRRRETGLSSALLQLAVIGAGIGTIAWLHRGA